MYIEFVDSALSRPDYYITYHQSTLRVLLLSAVYRLLTVLYSTDGDTTVRSVYVYASLERYRADDPTGRTGTVLSYW